MARKFAVPVELPGNPGSDLYAAPKQYVDAAGTAHAAASDPHPQYVETDDLAALSGGYLAGTVPDGSTSPVVQHDLGTKDLVVFVWEVSTGLLVGVPAETKNSGGTLSDNHIRWTFGTAPTAGQYRYVILSAAPMSSQLVPVPPVALTDAATIATDASLGTHFILGAMAGDRTLGAPTNPTPGQRVLWEITASAAPRTLTLTTSGARSFKLTVAAPNDEVAVPTGETVVIGAVYSEARDRFVVLAMTATVTPE